MTIDTGFGHYDFGLTTEQEAHARDLHAASIVVDMLYWGPVTHRSFTAEMETELMASGGATTYRLIQKHAAEGGELDYRQAWYDSGVTAGSRGVDLTTPEGVALTFGFHQRQFETFPWLRKALRAQDIRDAKANGQCAGWLNTQMVGGLRVDQLDSYYDLGLRMLMLTYNNLNHLGAGCTERTDAGVSNYGARVIARMNELGMLVDTSHCGKQTTLDACELSAAPVIVSHSCCEAVMPHQRAKSDQELEAIAGTGGLVGIVTVPFFLAAGDATMDSMLDHVDHAVRTIGWQHVGIGSDWPMMFPKEIVKQVFSPANLAETGFRAEHNVVPEQNLVGFDDYRDFPNVTRGLMRRGYTDEQIRGILGENFLRVFERVCG